MARLVENIYAVRARMVDGATVDLLLFADRERAEEYVQGFSWPLGFDYLEVVDRRVIGEIASLERRVIPRDPLRKLRKQQPDSAV